MRKRPYTEKALRRMKCIRCGERAFAQWNICADGNVYRPICASCDVELNTLVMRWAFGDARETDIAAYRTKFLEPALSPYNGGGSPAAVSPDIDRGAGGAHFKEG